MVRAALLACLVVACGGAPPTDAAFTAEVHLAMQRINTAFGRDVFTAGGEVVITRAMLRGDQGGSTLCQPHYCNVTISLAVTAYDMPLAITHELGHALGLVHTSDSEDVMYPATVTRAAPEQLARDLVKDCAVQGCLAGRTVRVAVGK